jgi:phosphoglycerol transferase MdoB-like AlkP superfamily enzyme
MRNSLLKKTLIQLVLFLGIFMFMRLVFVYHNRDIQPISRNLWENIQIIYWGFRYDLFSAIIFLSPVFLLSIITFLVPSLKLKEKLFKIETCVFFLITIFITTIMAVDVAYFRYNGRRSTVEVFSLFEHSKSAFVSFIKGYNELIVLLAIIILCLGYIYKKLISKPEFNLSLKQWIISGVVMFLIIFIGIGNKKRPLQPKTATYFVSSKYTSIITNTPLTLLYSLYRKQSVLTSKNYMSDKEARQIAPIFHSFKGKEFKKKNVVIFVLESFSREYLIDGHINRARTPFLDSLMQRSIIFENAYANATTSTYGIMCILGGLPAFMDEPYFSSIYSQNKFLGIGDMLKKEGYTSSFFFGAEDDHFGFRKKMALLGIDNYYSQEQLANYMDYHDGSWGVYDHVYFNFAAQELKKQPKPIFSTIFNISSHYPYKIPSNIKENMAEGRLPSIQSIEYVDYALRKFFANISNEPWYKETVFLFIADHWAKIPGIIENSMVGKYQIPAFMYMPAHSKQIVVKEIFQQLDVLPSILDTLGYRGRMMSFGKSIFDQTVDYRYTINEYENVFQIIDNTYVLTYNEKLEKSTSLFNHEEDKYLTKNLIKEHPEIANKMEKYVKANIQMYNNSLIDNKLHP